MPSLTIQFDPYDVLGLAEGASLEQIRDARRKAKVHHPDAGGEPWAFRILAQAYESLSTARVSRAAWAEFASRSPRPTPPPSAAPDHGANDNEGVTRPGENDVVLDPTRVVDIEKLWVRRERSRVWLLRDVLDAEGFLSCSLNVSWPSEVHQDEANAHPEHEALLAQLSEIFGEMQAFSGATAANFQIEEHWFSGWLSYPTPNLATLAFRQLHHALRSRGFSVRSWTRDLTIPLERR